MTQPANHAIFQRIRLLLTYRTSSLTTYQMLNHGVGRVLRLAYRRSLSLPDHAGGLEVDYYSYEDKTANVLAAEYESRALGSALVVFETAEISAAFLATRWSADVFQTKLSNLITTMELDLNDPSPTKLITPLAYTEASELLYMAKDPRISKAELRPYLLSWFASLARESASLLKTDKNP